MSMFVRFAPWLVFLTVTSATDWRYGLAAGLVAQIVAILATTPRRIGVLDGAMLVYFLGLGVFALVEPSSPLQHAVGIASMVWIAAVSAISILVGHPFTLDVSRDGVTPEVASSEFFLDINRTIAWAWVGCFTAIAAVGIIARVADGQGLGTVGAVLLVLAALNFTKHYPDRAMAAHHPTTPAPAAR